ncbi:MAG: hypothetical protein AAB774_02595 [Patescibacteria group bacterium]
MTMTPAQESLALQLFDIGAVKFGDFKLKLHETQPNAPLSPIYFNLRTPDNPKPGPITHGVMGLLGAVLYSETLRLGLAYDHIAGIPNAGDPFAKAFNDAVGSDDIAPANRLSFRKEDDGEKRRIGKLDGESFSSNQTVLLIDDLITRADTKFEAIKSVEDAGLKVVGTLVLIDREQGGRQQLEEAGYQLFEIYRLSELLILYVDQGRITQETADKVLTYLRENR